MYSVKASVETRSHSPKDLPRELPSLNDAKHVPGLVYVSPEIFEIEKRQIFMKDWICTIRSEEIPNAGDYTTMRLMGEPFVLCRDKRGEVNAFANICAHRGVEVVSGSGNAQEFICPYHAWLYDLEGKLVGAPYMNEARGFDLKNCRLKPLKVDIWEGWIFISFNDAAIPLKEHIAEFDSCFSFLQQVNCRLAAKIVVELNCNWKLMNENLMDMYHFKTLHASTFGSHLKLDNLEDRQMAGGAVGAFYKGAPAVPGGKIVAT
jgi:Rieske 2Fe-2S family protein